MTRQTFRLLITFVLAATLAVIALLRQPDASAQGGNPFDTGGRDDKPAGEVFKNIQFLKNLPAGRLAGVMTGWNNGLGVRCNHCHTPGGVGCAVICRVITGGSQRESLTGALHQSSRSCLRKAISL